MYSLRTIEGDDLNRYRAQGLSQSSHASILNKPCDVMYPVGSADGVESRDPNAELWQAWASNPSTPSTTQAGVTPPRSTYGGLVYLGSSNPPATPESGIDSDGGSLIHPMPLPLLMAGPLPAGMPASTPDPPQPALLPTAAEPAIIPPLSPSLGPAAAKRARRRRVVRPRELFPCIRCKSDHVPVCEQAEAIWELSANEPQCQRDTAVPDGPCQRCIRVHAYQQQPTRTSVPPAVPYAGCFRYRRDALRFFRTSTQPALQAGWGHTLAVNISVPTFGSVGNVRISYRHGGPFSLLVKQHVRPGSSAAVLAVYEVEQAAASYRAYLESGAEAAMDKAVNEAFPGSDPSSEAIANVYAAMASYYRSLPAAGTWHAFSMHNLDELRDTPPRNLISTALTLWLGIRQSTVASAPLTTLTTPADPLPEGARLSPGQDKFSVVTSQMDNIRCKWVLDHLSKEAVLALEGHTRQRRPESWQPVLFLTFTLLESIGHVMRDAYLATHRAQGNPLHPTPSPYRADLTAMHRTATAVLALWHHYNRGYQANDLASQADSPMSALSKDDFTRARMLYSLISSWRRISRDGVTPSYLVPGMEWTDPLYYAAQMFEGVSWRPGTEPLL